MESNNTDNNTIERAPKHRRPLEKISYAERGRFFHLRNVLNIVFILLAIAGMALFAYGSRQIGGALLIVAVVIKLVECVIRIARF